jgi:hypothetical protein
MAIASRKASLEGGLLDECVAGEVPWTIFERSFQWLATRW